MTQKVTLTCPDEQCAKCLEQQKIEVTRRSFFASLLGVGTAIIAAAIGMPTLNFILYPVRAATRNKQWSEVGSANEFERLASPVLRTIALTQRDGWREVVSEQVVFVNRNPAGQLQVLSPICPHLGCSVAWHDNQKKFICPCHGGQFDDQGRHISGPPPRGLDRLEARVKDGNLQVQFEYFRSNVPDQELLS